MHAGPSWSSTVTTSLTMPVNGRPRRDRRGTSEAAHGGVNTVGRFEVGMMPKGYGQTGTAVRARRELGATSGRFRAYRVAGTEPSSALNGQELWDFLRPGRHLRGRRRPARPQTCGTFASCATPGPVMTALLVGIFYGLPAVTLAWWPSGSAGT